MRRGAQTSTARPERWHARPRLAGLLRLTAHGVPVALSVAVVFAASGIVPPPRGSLGPYLLWWAALSAAATSVLVATGRLSRRLLPLAALMRLSLVFPDSAPSRFRLARRSRTVETLEARLDDARRGEVGRTPVEAAQLLLELVAHLDEHDELTRGHSERVRAYAQTIGRELGLDRRELDLLNWAALLHDVGKLEVPHEILTKAGRPTEDEWQLIRGHPAAGARLATPLLGWLGEWGAAIAEHHERWDGAGYPRGLAGDEISLAGRIVAVADVYDVLTSTRSYRSEGSAEAARRELTECAGTQFDPTIVRAFLGISVRPRGLVSGPLSWLAHVPVLARIPLTPAASAASTAAASAAAVAVGWLPAVAASSAGQEQRDAPLPARTAPAPVRPTDSSPAARRPARPHPAPARPTRRPRTSAPSPASAVTHPSEPVGDTPSAAAAPTAERTAPTTSSPAAPSPIGGVPAPPAGTQPPPIEDVREPVGALLPAVGDALGQTVDQVLAPVENVDPQQPVGELLAPVQDVLEPVGETVETVAPGVELGKVLPPLFPSRTR